MFPKSESNLEVSPFRQRTPPNGEIIVSQETSLPSDVSEACAEPQEEVLEQKDATE